MAVRAILMLLLHTGISFSWPTVERQISSDNSSECIRNCYAEPQGESAVYGWVSPVDDLPESGAIPNIPQIEWSSFTATVITQINTVVYTTQVVTHMPDDWTPPETNAEGTQIQRITYGDGLTTTIAFPTAFIAWPNDYAWSGTGWDADASACVTATTSSTSVLTRPGPQPTDAIDMRYIRYRNSTKPYSDPKGLFAHPFNFYGGGNWLFWDSNSVESLNFTGHKLLESCIGGADGGPNWGGMLTSWAISTSTVYTS
ncbi:hypothetical protein PFICI_08163 [Pestalotiopsis fici W106-1]|uniref:Uncharacterized protein n=1 Tax=Pestalotiopsis fici (strain W106-1 / CGMCC3.15140) TaxID=1229662 RepID=W3X3Q3_PESFW|nr:uncharacterized protein PFICI_08163 [Pestalotiopsis fici W106-1]ETS80634.1 hypothetical protein PFICI_08163 [Pestalotiopsis fici W106-1]